MSRSRGSSASSAAMDLVVRARRAAPRRRSSTPGPADRRRCDRRLRLLGVDVGGVVERHVAPRDARLDRLQLARRDAERRGQLLRLRLAAVALEALPLATQPIEAALLGARRAEAHHRPAATDVLLDVRANPPHRVGREAHAAPGVEAVDRDQETEVALLDQIEQSHPVGAVLEGDLDDEAQIARSPAARAAS